MEDESREPRAEILRTRDFIGWGVTDSGGAKVGTVSDLLIDRDGKVRFLAVDLGLFRKHVLVPVDVLEWGDGALVLPRWSADEVKRLPAYNDAVPLSREVLEEMERAHPRYYRAGPLPPPVPADQPRIVPLKEAKEFKLAKGAPNLRGWTVYGGDNERAGTVSEMLVDPVALKIRYLDVDLADDLFTLKEDRHVLVPLEATDLRERGEDVWVKSLTARELGLLPAYTGGPVDPLVEAEVRRAFRLDDGEGGPPPIIVHDEPEPLDSTSHAAGHLGPAVDPGDLTIPDASHGFGAGSAPDDRPPPTFDDSAPPRLSERDALGPPLLVDDAYAPPLDREPSGPPPLDRELSGPPPVDRELAGPPPLDPERSGPPPIIDESDPPPLPPEARAPDAPPPNRGG